MLAIYLFILMFTNSINQIQKNIHSTFINRITILTLLLSILFTYNTLYFQLIGKGISIYSGLFQITIQSQWIEIVLILVGISIFFAWPFLYANNLLTFSLKEGSTLASQNKEIKNNNNTINYLSIKTSDQYSLIAIFSILGGSLLMSSLDLLSMYLSIELQSFALYILATLNKERLSATSAGLKYFLLGSLSSCFILLGSAIIYSYTGLTQFESINSLMSIPINYIQGSDTELLINNYAYYAQDIKKAFIIGLIILIIGFLFKISAAPFYQWAPDVYDGTPPIVTVWLTIVVKLTIFIFLFGLIEYTLPALFCLPNSSVAKETFSNVLYFAAEEQIKNLLLICSLLSLLIGTIAGLSQIKFKRLLAFSSISHVGFLLLALGIYTQKSIDSFLFYLIQYSITSLNIFLILLAFSYFIILPNFKLNPNLKQVKQLNKDKNNNSIKNQMIVLDDITNSLIPNNTYFNIEEEVIIKKELFAKHANQQVNLDVSKIDENYVPGFTKINENVGSPIDINYILELKGQLYNNPILSISIAICLFSMAGVPPLIGFFSKQFVLFSSIENGYNLLSIIAILVSVISASYYLRIIKITFFDSSNATNTLFSILKTNNSITSAKKDENNNSKAKEFNKNGYTSIYSYNELNYSLIVKLSKTHSYIIAILTFLILFFFLDPSILLNGTQLISLTLFNI